MLADFGLAKRVRNSEGITNDICGTRVRDVSVVKVCDLNRNE